MIPPALTSEQWAQLSEWDRPPKAMSNSYLGDSVSADDGYANERHALCAIALYQQPFGFTQEEANALMMLAQATQEQFWHDAVDDAVIWQSLAAKIAALLPPSP